MELAGIVELQFDASLTKFQYLIRADYLPERVIERPSPMVKQLLPPSKLPRATVCSTSRSNLSVGLPIDMLTYETNILKFEHTKRIGQDDPYFKMLSFEWSKALRAAFQNIEAFDI